MKKVAVLIYDRFCNFEFSVALEMLAMARKPITVFAKSLDPVCSEEGLTVIPDQTIEDIRIEEYDSLILTGCADIREAVEDKNMLSFIKLFDTKEAVIGAISIAPVMLMKTDMLKDKKFMIGALREDLMEEGFKSEEMKLMVDWNDNIRSPIEAGYIQDGNIITSVSYEYGKWAMAFGRALGLEVYPKCFGLDA